MAIQDLASNPLITQSSPMIGYVDPGEVPDDLQLRMYFFILESIRKEDQLRGEKFLERFLEGPEEVWRINDQAIRNLPVLWDVSAIPGEFLPFLKNIVGWTSELDNITDGMDELTLRRLIRASVPFWKRRGPEDAIGDIIRLTTNARMRIWNWFDFRMVMDETGMGEEHDGRDPWMISLPGVDGSERTYNVRIVDDGTLDRALVINLVKLTRPGNERVDITYLGFLDLFQVDDDKAQWIDEPDPLGAGGAPTASTVASGVMSLASSDVQDAYVDKPASGDWANYVATWRLRGTYGFGGMFYRTANTDFYAFYLDTNANTANLVKYTAGTPGVLAVTDMLAAHGVTLLDDVYYAMRVAVTPEAGSNRIKLYFDATLVASVLDADHAQGTVGVALPLSGPAQAVELDELEVFFNPLQSDFVDINS